MQDTLEFQGHTYKLLEEGIYEAIGDFVLDNEDWLFGDHPDMAVACKVVGDKPYVWLLAVSWKYEDRMLEIAYENTEDPLSFSSRENSEWVDIGGLTYFRPE